MIRSYILISRWSKVHGQAAERPGQPARQDGGTYPIACLTHRCVGKTDDGEAGQTIGEVDLDGYGLPDHSPCTPSALS